MKKPTTSAKTAPLEAVGGQDIHIIGTHLSAKDRFEDDGRAIIEMARHWTALGASVTLHTNHDGYLVGSQSDLHNVNYSVWVNDRWRRLGTPIAKFFQGIESVARAGNIKTNGVILAATGTWTDVLAAQRAKRNNPKAKLVCTVRAVKPWGRRLRSAPGLLIKMAVNAALTDQVGRDADLVLAFGDDHLDDLEAQVAGRAFALSPGIDHSALVSKIRPRKKYDCCFMAAGERVDGWENMAKMWRHVCLHRPDSRLAIILDGDKASFRAKRLFSRGGPAGNVTWLVGPDKMEKRRALLAGKIFVAPFSYAGRVAIGEAMAAGLPVIGYDTPALRDYPKGRLTVPEGDWASLGHLLIHVMNHRSLYLRLKREAKAACVGRDWRTCAAAALDSIHSAA